MGADIRSAKLSYVKTLCHCTGVAKQELKGLMLVDGNGGTSGAYKIR